MSGIAQVPDPHGPPLHPVLPDRAVTPGVTLTDEGAWFTVYARRASGMELLLFDGADDPAPARVVALDPLANRTGPWWHVFAPGVRAGQLYAWRADGPWAPERGIRFDRRLALLDPYGCGVAVPSTYRRTAAPSEDGSLAASLKSVVVDLDAYDWEGDRPLGRPLRGSVIYEAHLRGMTASATSPAAPGERGTYRGMIAAIPHIAALGVTAVELLPVYAFDHLAAPAGLVNYWGYEPVGHFAPHPGYATRPDAQAAADELRDLVKALHRAGLEVILDVVYNHTAEDGLDGPTFGFRGLANDDYYLLADDPARYQDVSGVGNSLDAGSPLVRRLILDSLRFWVERYHVDGFRFDLAAVLARDEHGRPVDDPAILLDIETDPVLAGTKLIAEPWDAGGLYLVGSFPGDRWVEWNGRFRDDIRSFVRSDPGQARNLGLRMLGSPDLYTEIDHPAPSGVNFVTCHDGFTLNDLVSYDRKHNEANGEGNRDGNDDNRSWNCGAEGPTEDPGVNALRERQVRSLLALTLLSAGVPMLLAGDEARRTQGGNNNAYCHDDATTWLDWDLVRREADLVAYTGALVALRARLMAVLDGPADATLRDALAAARVAWSGTRYGEPDLGEGSRSLALTFHGPDAAMHLVANAYWEPLAFDLPPADPGDGPWRVVLDTGRATAEAVTDPAVAAPVEGLSVTAGPRSVLLLVRPHGAAPDAAVPDAAVPGD